METTKDISIELQQLSPTLAAISKMPVYQLPAGYFDRLPEQMLNRVLGEATLEASVAQPFAVPEGYFESLAGNVLARIKAQAKTPAEELARIAPLLNTISKEPVFTVPQGYFESLELTLPLAVMPAKVVRMPRRRIWQLAVAACTTAVIAVGAFLFTGKDDAGTAAVIPYDSAVNMNLAAELDDVNEQEINTYLSQSATAGVSYNTVIPEDVNVEEYLQETSDEEIREYLQQAPAALETTGS